MPYTQDQKDLAISRYQAVGCLEASREVGIPSTTVSRWAIASGAGISRPQNIQAMNDARMLQTRENLSRIAEIATETVLEALESEGTAKGHRETIGAWTRAIHDYQLLTGGATERIQDNVIARAEQILDDLEQRRQKKESAA